ncbi:MAG TPA: RelA/SpoT domain-containing protein [Acidobacteriaceae bacterium]|jgi:ppGpp synthetase/RelA/SpoT-type nucleotidyltranferase
MAKTGLKIQGITWRVKDREKLKRKYENPDKSYFALSDITDLAGLRIITYLAKDVDLVAEIVRREFELDEKNTVDKRKGDPEKLGYQSLHYICGYSRKRIELLEYEKFNGIKFEIQIRSLLQHAWAELQHGAYDLQSNLPDEIKNRFSCLSGLLQLADREFASILDEQAKYAKSTAVIVETKVGNLDSVNLDALSLAGFVSNSSQAKELDAWLAANLGVPLDSRITPSGANLFSIAANFVGLKTLGDLDEALNKFSSELLLFEQKMIDVWSVKLRPKSLSVGICVYRLSLYLAAKRGPEFTRAMLDSLGVKNQNSEFVTAVVAAAQAA